MNIAERLAALRAELAKMEVDGFWMPRTDEHGSEYLPPHAERVAWLTGFTGSAGVVLVLPDMAAVMSDGRYTVQLERELDPALFQRANSTLTPPSAWLAEHVRQGARIGYDPRLVRKPEREAMAKKLTAAGATLVALDRNPIDLIWHDRPARPAEPVHSHPKEYAGEEAAAKTERMGVALAKAGADQLLITAPESIAWLLNVRGADVPFNPLPLGFALLGTDGHVRLFTDRTKLAGLDLGNRVTVEDYEAFEPALDELGGRRLRLLVDPAYSAVGFADRFARAGGTVIDGEDPIPLARAMKNHVEVAGAYAAQRRDGAAMSHFLCWLTEEAVPAGTDEIEAATKLASLRAEDALFRGLSFDSISAHGPNAAQPHYRTSIDTNRRLETGSVYLIDSGGQYLDGTTDITRTIGLGQVPAYVRVQFTLVLQGMIALSQAVFPEGTSGAQLDTLARAPLWRQGFDFDHGTGHGVGSYLCVHEGPARIAKGQSLVKLQPGMILSNEPGQYVPGSHGIRTENLLVVQEAPTPPGGERKLLRFGTLTLVPIDRTMIVAAMLSADERAWLDAYHARVLAEVGPLVDERTLAWLQRACAPI
ncbi:MAG TPA: aminopeptidase P family protein [Geminicoccus sp.]|uniref:aminopeptidase P family protein n=1 Tax=Geminicoccus sp. TaxID=2024832 RepID=UPI002E34A859|nr:aminopeptidase P family protein [Geminicoccus sp.]HEX2527048.1 aminopeptidase P family protein [Geminicoccus sp.]